MEKKNQLGIHVDTDGWFMLYGRNHNIVKQLSFN